MPRPDIFRQFNKFAEDNQSVIGKALTSAAGVGAGLSPQNLEQIITDTVIRMSPELALVFKKKISGKRHEFNQLLERPTRGGAMGENATTPISNSKTALSTVDLKIIRRKGKVTNFLSDVSEDYIDATAYELENHIQAHILDLIYYVLFGNANANAWEFSGIEQFATSNRVHHSLVEGGAVPTSLKFLNRMIDTSNRKGGNKHDRVFLMSPEMLSLVSDLLTNVRLNQQVSGSGLTQVDIEGGWRLNAYRDIPIVESTSMAPIEALSSTPTITGVASGGGLSDDDYFIYISPITYEGEQAPCTEETITLSAGGAVQRIKIDLDAPHTTDSIESVLGYKIYLGLATGSANCTLLKQVSAFTYDAEGTVDGDNGVDESIYIDSLTPGTDVPTHMQNDIPLIASGGYYPENIVLWDLDPIQGLGKLPFTNKAGDRFEGLIVTQPLAVIDDYISFLTKSYTCLTPSFEKTSYWLRNVRTA